MTTIRRHNTASLLSLAGMLCMAAPAVAAGAPGALRTYCGERQGTAGEASLVDRRGRTTIELAHQGGDQHLLDQADDRAGPDRSGETGTQVGQSYCLTTRLDKLGNPSTIVRVRRITSESVQKRR